MVSGIGYLVSGGDKAKPIIKGFTDLVAWQEGHKLALMIYNVTKKFPSDEKHGLSNQMRRACVSVTSNIAEGFSRATASDKARFYDMSLGSVTELQNQLLLARDLHYIEASLFEAPANQSVRVLKLTTGLRKAVMSGKGVRPRQPNTRYQILDTEERNDNE